MKSENICLLGIGVAILICFSFAVGSCTGRNCMWDSAVNHDVAEYVCDDGKGCRFEWKDRLDD